MKVYPDNKDTALEEGEEYEFPELIFHQKNGFEETIYITVHKTARMETGTYNLKFSLVSNENFFATRTGSLEAELRVTAQISQPSWWSQTVSDIYLGPYGDEKFKLFAQNIFNGDFGTLDDDEKRYYALKFKYWLEENPHYDDHVLITVTIQG